uniref:Uncharacterized protein n=1 Tax=Pogona vitticeps TaxID=103695 RepID=A0ABM5GIF9_9SAUR
MAEKENKAPEPVHKPEEQKVTACMTLSKPRKRYMSSDSDSENGPPGALKRLEEPDGQCHPRKTSCYNEKTSETQEMRYFQAGGYSLKKHKDMQALVRVCLFAMLKDALSQHLIKNCPGCQEDLCGQQAHLCLGWNDANYSKMLNEICSKLCYKKVILVITITAFQTKKLCMTNRTLIYIHKIIKSLTASAESYNFLKRLLRSTDEQYLDIVKRTLQQVYDCHFYCCPNMRD